MSKDIDLNSLSKEELIALLSNKDVKAKPKRGRPKKIRGERANEVIIDEVINDSSTEKPTYITNVVQPNKNRKRIDPDTGLEDGVYTIGVPATAQAKPVDEGVYKQDASFDSKVVHSRVPRREPAKKISTKCEGCHKTFEVPPIFLASKEFYFCDKCIMRKGSR